MPDNNSRFLQNRMRKMAWKFILEQHINYLPVDPFRLAFQMKLHIMTYRQYARLVGMPLQTIIDRCDHDGFTFWSNRRSAFIHFYYSDLPFPICRCTLLFEIAHIYLGHISSRCTSLRRVRTKYRSVYEIEAQGFARRVLCPSIVLHNCGATEPEEIMNLCGISYTAASYRSAYMKTLEQRGKFRMNATETTIEKQFASFVQYYRHIQLPQIPGIPLETPDLFQ